jgi:hypothetical protein
MRYIKALKLAPCEFKRMYGVTAETFWEMVKAVRDGKQGSRGSHASLPIPDQILLTLQYWREYRTYFHIAQDWGIHESTAQRTVKRIEDILIKSGKFGLPSRRKLWKDTAEIEVIAIDVAETEIERPKKKQKKYYSGKQRCHTLKIQLLINQGTQEILCTTLGIGKEHDFRIFKNSRIKAKKEIQIVADKGYQGIKTYHNNSKIPYKKQKKGKLSQEQKEFNRQQARVRIKVEHVIRLLKVFRILSSRYRNRRKRFGLRVNLIAGIYNYELKLASKF